MGSYNKINLGPENPEMPKTTVADDNIENEMNKIRIENAEILTIAFSITAICSAIVAGTAVSAVAFL